MKYARVRARATERYVHSRMNEETTTTTTKKVECRSEKYPNDDKYIGSQRFVHYYLLILSLFSLSSFRRRFKAMRRSWCHCRIYMFVIFFVCISPFVLFTRAFTVWHTTECVCARIEASWPLEMKKSHTEREGMVWARFRYFTQRLCLYIFSGLAHFHSFFCK